MCFLLFNEQCFRFHDPASEGADNMLGMVTTQMTSVPLLPLLVQGSHQSQQSTPAGGPQKNLIPAHSVANPLPSTRSQPLGGMPSGPPMDFRQVLHYALSH